MFYRSFLVIALLVAVSGLLTSPAAAQGEIVITQAKANAGGVTPGDGPGFPVTLSLPGAYVLGSNLNPPAGKNGLVIKSHNVDIDMNGFRLNGGDVANVGVYSTFGQSRIHDGFIVFFKSHGIFLTGNVNAWTVENMQIIQNGGFGVYAEESVYARYLNNNIVANGGGGIRCGHYCHVEGNTISDNKLIGVEIHSGTVLDNTIFGNGQQGIYDDYFSADTGFGDNTVVGNNGNGEQVHNVVPLHPNFCSPNPC
jgi:parallel beta-helix repeat protein